MSSGSPSSSAAVTCPPEGPLPRSGNRWVWLPLVVFAAAWIAHGGALANRWVGDDAALVRDHPVVRHGPAAAADSWAPDVWRSEVDRGAWRPLPVLSYALEAPLWRGETTRPRPFGFHLTNLFLHGFCSVLILAVAWRLAPHRPLLGGGAALLFAVHPLHAGTVSALSGRADLLALFFCLVCAWLWLRGGPKAPWVHPLAALAWFLALLSKEAAVGFPLLLFILDAGPRGFGVLRTLERNGWAYALLLVPLGLFLLRWPTVGPSSSAALPLGLEGLARAALAFVLPVGVPRDRHVLTAGLQDLGADPLALVAGIVLCTVALVVLARLLLGRRLAPGALALLATVALWLAATLASPLASPLEARFAYVTAPALFLFGGLAWESLVGDGTPGSPSRPVVGHAGFLILLVAAAGLTRVEDRVWKDDITYHRALLDRYPGDAAVIVRMCERLREEAERAGRESALLPSTHPERGALIELRNRRLAEVEGWARAAVDRTDPGEGTHALAADAHRELGFALLEQGRPAEALHHLDAALGLDPLLQSHPLGGALPAEHASKVAETHLRLARSLQAQGRLREAAGHVRQAARQAPGDAHILQEAGRAFVRAQLFGEGLLYLRQAVDVAADRATARRELRMAQRAAADVGARRMKEAREAEARSEPQEAIRLFQAALAALPTLLEPYLAVARLRGSHYGNYRRAHEILDAAERMLEEAEPRERAKGRRLIADRRERLRKQQAEDERAEAE